MTFALGAEPVDVLLVEDNRDDAALIVRTLGAAKVRNRVHVATDGAEALDYLHGRGKHAGARRPELILLDLGLPQTDGRAVLEEIKGDEALRRIPVIVMTDSASDEDVSRSYRLNANAYVTKPVNPADLVHVIKSIEQFWLQIVRLP